MKRGPKALLPSQKASRGTLQPCRDKGKIEMIEPDALPVRPDWLTAAGEEVWLDEIGRVVHGQLVAERDSAMFGTFCNLMGAINLAWRTGEVPPAAHLSEARKMAEQFGIFGAKSRLQLESGNGQNANPFTRNRA
jgi:hypothetical protein